MTGYYAEIEFEFEDQTTLKFTAGPFKEAPDAVKAYASEFNLGYDSDVMPAKTFIVNENNSPVTKIKSAAIINKQETVVV